MCSLRPKLPCSRWPERLQGTLWEAELLSGSEKQILGLPFCLSHCYCCLCFSAVSCWPCLHQRRLCVFCNKSSPREYSEGNKCRLSSRTLPGFTRAMSKSRHWTLSL